MQVAAAVGGMNAALASPAGRAAVPPTGTTTPSLAKRLQEAQRNPHLARLLGSSGSGDAAELPVKGAKEGGSHAWGSAAQPWQIAAAGQAFVREHVRMQDALLYMR